MKDIITAAALRARAKAQHTRELQDQLQAAEASRAALAAALVTAQTVLGYTNPGAMQRISAELPRVI